ncbi:MAG TPA: hypothetical protein VGQ46_03020 [Thermoanaerobaculia bacterium]|jgi:hypothetical protein|nr:hypothetical protein [Thermoanaerobaculia bacterium]
MAATAVSISLNNIHSSDEGDGPGSAEPFLWTVFFKVDGDTVNAESGTLQGTATVVGTPGNHGDLNTNDVDAGDDVPIPASLGQFSAFVKPIAAQAGTLLPGVIGYVATLLEQDSTPGHAIATGHNALNQAVQAELNNLIPTLTLEKLNNLDPVLKELKDRVSAKVKSAISNSQSAFEKLTHPNQDDTIGTDVKVIFAQDDKVGTSPFDLKADPIAIDTPFHSEGSWGLTGRVAVLPSRQLFLRIIGRPGHSVPIVGSGPLSGVSVQLFELDDPAPAGDDTVIPPVGETDVIVGGREITDTKTYQTLADQSLGTQTTNAAGVVAFQVLPNRVAGVLTHTHTVEDLRDGGKTTSTTTNTSVAERAPDYGVTVVGHSGRRLAIRQLVALNASGNVGTATSPVDVLVERDEQIVVATT